MDDANRSPHGAPRAGRRRGLRIALPIGGALAVLVAACGAVAMAFMHEFYPTPPAPDFPAPRSAAEEQLQDLTYLRQYLSFERSYTPEARAAATALLDESTARARTGAVSVSTADFDLAVARIAALADNGHSRVKPLSLRDRHRHLPCRMYHFDDGFYVLRARAACKELLGTKVVAIDGRPIDEVADGMYRYFGGPRNHYDQFAAVFFLESPELLHAAGLAASDERLTLSVIDKDGAPRDAIVEGDPADPEAARIYSDEILDPAHVRDEKGDWTTFLPTSAALPPFLRDYDDPFHAQALAEKQGVYYVQFRSNEDEDGYPIGPFVERVRKEIQSVGPRSVVLDLRLDQGGNFLKTASLMEDLAGLSGATAHVYVLTSAWTFSAGIVDLALLKEHGGGKVVVIGAPVGDRLRFRAEGRSLKLPNSKLVLTFATGLYDFASPCTGQDDCFWLLRFYPTHVATLDPDVRVPYTFADYAALRDPALDKTLSLAQ